MLPSDRLVALIAEARAAHFIVWRGGNWKCSCGVDGGTGGAAAAEAHANDALAAALGPYVVMRRQPGANDEAAMTAVLQQFGWTVGPEFWQRYYSDVWVFNLANAVLALSGDLVRVRGEGPTPEAQP